jgi:hypothetical protein
MVADKRTSKDTAHLVTKNKYKEFQIYAEFWASDGANSGIFIRCIDPNNIGARTCYEVNIFDQRKDPTYGTGAIVYFSEVNPMKTAELHNGMFEEAPFTLQHGDGVIKWRKVAVKPL